MYQIFTGKQFENVVRDLHLTSAKKLFTPSVEDVEPYYFYEVWELSAGDFNIIDNLIDWPDKWGWWRWATGSNIETSPTYNFTVNNKEVKLYYSEIDIRDWFAYLDEERDSPEWWPECDAEITEEMKTEYFKWHNNYSDIFRYCTSIWGVSTEKNIVAIIVANAKLNNMTNAEFMQNFIK